MLFSVINGAGGTSSVMNASQSHLYLLASLSEATLAILPASVSATYPPPSYIYVREGRIQREEQIGEQQCNQLTEGSNCKLPWCPENIGRDSV